MRWPIFAVLPLLTAAALPDTDRQRDAIMDEIEKTVILPARAGPFSAYGRNYAFDGLNRVIAVYFIPESAFDESTSCVLGTGAPCPKAERDRLTRESAVRRASMAIAGGRRWFENTNDLPNINDGGCSKITIHYDVPARQVLSVACNGR